MRASVVRQVECEERKLSGRLEMARSQHSIKSHHQHPRNSSSSSVSLPASYDKQANTKRSRHEVLDSRYSSAVGRREMQRQHHQQVTASEHEQQVFSVVEVNGATGQAGSRTSSGSSSGYNGRGHFYRPHHGQFEESSSGRPAPPPRPARVLVGAHYDLDNVELSLERDGHQFDAGDIVGDPGSSLLIDDDDDADGTYEQHPAPAFNHGSHQHPQAAQHHSLQCADSELPHHSSLALHHHHQQQATAMRRGHHRDELLLLARPGSRYSLSSQSRRERLANELIDSSQQPTAYSVASINEAQASLSSKHRKLRDTSTRSARELQLANSNQQLFYQHHSFVPHPSEIPPGYHLFPVEPPHHHHFRYLEPTYLYPSQLSTGPLVHNKEHTAHHQQASTTTKKKMHPPSREPNPAHHTPSSGPHHQRRNQHSTNRKHRPSSRSSTSSALKSPMSCCGKLTKLLLFLANLLFWTTGVALGSWGILSLVDDHKYNLSQLLVFEPSGRMSLFQLLSWSFITLGCATVLVGFCGCSAILKNNRWILGLYIFLILAIFALDLATGLLAIIFQERLVASVRLKLANKLRSDYGVHASFTAALDYIQTRYECCGSEGHLDYEQSLWRLQRLGGFEATVARTCCHLRNTYDDQAHVNPRPVNESMCQSTDIRFHQSYRYRKGCIDDLERLIRQKIWNFIMGCGAAGAVILISLMFATCFCRLIPKSKSRKSSVVEHSTGNRNHSGNNTK